MAPARPGRERLRDASIGAMLALFAAAYYASFFAKVPYPFADEGYLDYIAFAFNAGQLPYRDIQLYSYPPGIFHLVAAVLDLSSNSTTAVRLLFVALLVGGAWLLYAASRRILPPTLAALVTLAIIVVPGGWDRAYMFTLQMALLLFLLELARSERAWAGFGLGAALAAAFAVRIDVALSGVFLAFCWLAIVAFDARLSPAQIVRRTKRPTTMALVGFLCLALPYSLFLAARGTLLGQLEQYGRFLSGRLTRIGYAENLDPPALRHLLTPTTEPGFVAWAFYGSFAVVLWLALHCLLQWRRRHPATPPRLAAMETLVLAWALSNVPHYAFDRPDIHHLTLHGYAIMLPLGIACREALAWTRDSARRLPGIVLGSGALLYGILYVGGHLHTEQSGTIAAARSDVEARQLSNGMTVHTTADSSLLSIAEYLIRNTGPDERVAAFPYLPTYNFLAGRLMPGRDVFVIPEYTTAEVERRVIRDLASVRVVLYAAEQSIHGKPSSLPRNFMPEVHAYLMRNFRESMRAGGVLVLERIGAPDAP